MTIRIIDAETTGIDPETDKVCEIAAIDLNANGTISNAFNTLVDPGKPIPYHVSAVTGIIDADVAGKPTIEQVIEPLKGATYYVAHNADFDAKFMTPYLGDVKWFCTYKAALRLWPDAVSHSNQSIRYMLGLVDPLGVKRSEIDPHRALSDVLVTGAIFLHMTKIARWQDMLAWQAEPPLHSRITFGKHKGQQLIDVPVDYLGWIKRSDMDEGWKFSADYWLAARKAA